MVVRGSHTLRRANAPCNVLAVASEPALALFIAAGKTGAKNPSGEFTVMVVFKSNGFHSDGLTFLDQVSARWCPVSRA